MVAAWLGLYMSQDVSYLYIKKFVCKVFSS